MFSSLSILDISLIFSIYIIDTMFVLILYVVSKVLL